jgi:hypothetical protein
VVWVILLRLPKVFWHELFLEFIGNKVGHFGRLEKDWSTKLDRRWARVQVEVYLNICLLEEAKKVLGKIS